MQNKTIFKNVVRLHVLLWQTDQATYTCFSPIDIAQIWKQCSRICVREKKTTATSSSSSSMEGANSVLSNSSQFSAILVVSLLLFITINFLNKTRIILAIDNDYYIRQWKFYLSKLNNTCSILIVFKCRITKITCIHNTCHGINYNFTWTPPREVTPMYRNTPYSTGIGINYIRKHYKCYF